MNNKGEMETEIKVPEKTKEAVKALLDYEFKYGMKDKEKPIAIVGPDGSEENHLRVYAYGGLIGRINLTEKTQCKLEGFHKHKKDDEDEYDYGKYLKDNYQNGHGQIFNYDQIRGFNRLKLKLDTKDLYECICSIDNEERKKKEKKYELLTNPDKAYLDLIIAAAYTRFMHRTGTEENTRVVSYSERSMQTLIASYNRKKSNQNGKSSWVVVDIEYKLSLKNDKKFIKRTRYEELKQRDSKGKWKPKKDAKIDFVVFDGIGFGLIEFKYQGESMEAGTNNSLEAHYKDFKRIIKEDDDENKNKLMKELIKRTEILAGSGVIEIDSSMEEGLKDLKKKIKYNTVNYGKDLWCGFLFLGSGNKNIMGEMNKQVGDISKDGLEVYFQLAEQDKKPEKAFPIVINMKEYEYVKQD